MCYKVKIQSAMRTDNRVPYRLRQGEFPESFVGGLLSPVGGWFRHPNIPAHVKQLKCWIK